MNFKRSFIVGISIAVSLMLGACAYMPTSGPTAKKVMHSGEQIGEQSSKAAEDLEASKVVRPRTDANYQRITELIFATYLLGDAAIRAEIAPLIDRLNQFIAEQKTAHRQSQAQKKKGEDGGETAETTTVETH